jgi:hypothetical protein
VGRHWSVRPVRYLFALLVLVPLAFCWARVDLTAVFAWLDETVGGARERDGEVGDRVRLGAALIGAGLCLTGAWRALRYIDTLFHELGHASFAALLGARVRKITVNFDASGVAAYQMPAGWGRWRRLLVAFVGYPFPAAVAVAAVPVLQSGGSVWAVWYLALLGVAAVALLVRNVWGIATTLLFALVFHLVATNAGPIVTDIVLAGAVGVFAVGSVRAALEQLQLRDLDGSDAGTLARLTFLPARVVACLHLLVCVALGVCALWWLGAPVFT